jgi:hypothetical protein
MLNASADFRQSHSLFNPVKPVVALTPDFLLFCNVALNVGA